MEAQIRKVLSDTPGLKGRQIANKLGLDKRDVNSYLSKQNGVFVKDGNHCWFIADTGLLEIQFDGGTWIDGIALDRSIKRVGAPLSDECLSIHFIVPAGCKILLEAAARLLAFSNQSILLGKSVTIDFEDCQETLRYFNRIGFFDLLDDGVVVKPGRPSFPSSTVYKGNSEAVFEFGEVDPDDLDEDIPQQLKNCFVYHAGDVYSQPVFTVLSELFGNVRDHSRSPIAGYIALQRYKGYGGRRPVPPHIQTIVSDSGKGIAGTLIPILKDKYPALAKKFDFNDPKSAPLLIKEVFEKGMISSSDDEGRGLGLKRSGDVAASYRATISVRESGFELKLKYENGKLKEFLYELDLPNMLGTHICFDFILDKS